MKPQKFTFEDTRKVDLKNKSYLQISFAPAWYPEQAEVVSGSYKNK